MVEYGSLLSNPQNLRTVTLYSKRDLVDVFSDLRCDYSGLAGWGQHNHRGSLEEGGRRANQGRRWDDENRAERVRELSEDTMLLALKMEKGTQAEEYRSPLEAGSQGNR